MASDVIDAMVAAITANFVDDTEDEGVAEDMIAALRAAEKAGWRLVPTKASGKQVDMLIAQELSHAFYERLIDAAPSPWNEVER